MGLPLLSDEEVGNLVPYDINIDVDEAQANIVKEKLYPTEGASVEITNNSNLLNANDLINLKSDSPQGEERLVEPWMKKLPSEEYSPLESAGYGAINFLPSAGNVVANLGVAAYNPVDTMHGLIDLVSGYANKALPTEFVEKKDQKLKSEAQNIFKKRDLYKKQAEKFEVDGNKSAAKRYRKFASDAARDAGEMTDRILRQGNTADTVNKFYKERYGSWDGFRKAIAEDPAMILMDITTVLRGGAGLKIPKVSPVLSKTANILETPIRATGKAVGATAKFGVDLTKNALDIIGPKVGLDALGQAFKSGLAKNETFINNMNQPEIYATNVVDKVKAILNDMKIEKNTAYKNKMAKLKTTESSISFDSIDKAMKKIYDSKVKYKTNKPDPERLARWQKIKAKIDEYKKNKLNKPDDFDQLKQDINAINDDLQYGSQDKTIFDPIQRTVRESINKDAPVYADIMKDYMDAAIQIQELDRTFSLNKGRTGKTDTALRKLQSIFRNNSNTNYGARVGNIQSIVDRNPDIMPALAGQMMSSDLPRGLDSLIPKGASVGMMATAGAGLYNPMMIPLMLAQSPKLIGNTLYKAGSGLKSFDDIAGNLPSRGLNLTGNIAKNLNNINTLRPASLLDSLNTNQTFEKELREQAKKRIGLLLR